MEEPIKDMKVLVCNGVKDYLCYLGKEDLVEAPGKLQYKKWNLKSR